MCQDLSMANRQIHCSCGFIYCVSQEITKSITDHYVVTKCPNCCTWANECLHCSACFMNSRYKNDLRSIKYHVEREHPKTLPYNHMSNESEMDTNQLDDMPDLSPRGKGDDADSDSDDDDDYHEPNDGADDFPLETAQPNDHPYHGSDQMEEIVDFDSFNIFSNKESNAYFWQEYICNIEDEVHGGLRGVVWRSLFRRKLYDKSRISSLSDTILLFNMTAHTMSNTHDENDTFFDILEVIIEKTNGTDFEVTVPIDHKAANEILMESKYGIYGNLPYEDVFEVNGHACVSLIGTLKSMYAHGIPIGFTQETDVPGNNRDWSNKNGSVAMTKLLEFMKGLNPHNKPTKYGSYIFWSDGFLRSFVKQKNNNVWILTVTFPDPKGSATSKYHTYCLAVGKSSNDHQPVIDHFLKEIETLASGVDVFCPKEGRFIRLQMALLAYIADRPERHSILNQSQGGTFGKRTLWSCVIDYKNLPYCDACFGNELRGILSDKYSPSNLRQCGRCCQWNMNSTSTANHKVKPSEVNIAKKYPTECDPMSPTPPEKRSVPINYLKPIQLSYCVMIRALRFAAHNVAHFKWNKGTTQAYLRSCAIPDRVTDKMYNQLHEMEDSEETTDGACQSDIYIPYVWRSSVSMCAWIDAGMHLIFHGIIATIMKVMEEVFAGEARQVPFEDLINPYLLSIQELRLDWLHVKTLPKTLWLAEDELGFSRILLFAYGQFFLNIKLRESSNISKGTLLSMRQMLIALHVMVALLMSPKDPIVDVTDRHIKIFLSCCQRFNSLYYDGNDEPFWSLKSNFVSLLNLASQIPEYGPIRWYWEGTCESYIQTVKKVLVSMRKTTSYFMRKMEVMQKVTTISWLKDKLRKNGGRERSQYPRMYHRYESLDEVKESFESGDLLSGLTTKIDEDETLEGHFWIVFGTKGRTISIVPVIIDKSQQSKLLCGLSYHGYRLGEDDDCISDLTRDELGEIVSDYCLLLPYSDDSETVFEKFYGIVFSDWDVIDVNGQKNLPELCPQEFALDAMTLT